MDYRPFGRTGLNVSVIGLGGGGASRLGLGTGSSFDEAVAVVARAVDLGINYFDTAADYDTEEVIGKGLEAHRSEVMVSSKASPRISRHEMSTRKRLRESLEGSLLKLRTDYLDVFHLHRVSLGEYEYCASELLPELMALRDEGKIRCLGISESNSSDPEHLMLQRALEDDCWDAVMVGFNLFNQSARTAVIARSAETDRAVEIMASARSEFSQPSLLAAAIAGLVESGDIAPELAEAGDPLALMGSSGNVESLTELSYRFALSQPGVSTILVGTGKIDHLEENVRVIARGPLPGDLTQRLASLFGHLARPVVVPGRVSRP